jgi:hypothetical protein
LGLGLETMTMEILIALETHPKFIPLKNSKFIYAWVMLVKNNIN